MEIPLKKEVFKLSLPITPPGQHSSLVMEAGSSRSLPKPKKKVWILVAEDNKVNQTIVLKNLEKLGYQAVAAENGRAALQLIEREPQKWDLIIMDLHMPEMDGLEATKLIRSWNDPHVRTLPIVALTASVTKNEREKAIEAGMDDHLSKPAPREVLAKTLLKWLFKSEIRRSHLEESQVKGLFSPPLSDEN